MDSPGSARTVSRRLVRRLVRWAAGLTALPAPDPDGCPAVRGREGRGAAPPAGHARRPGRFGIWHLVGLAAVSVAVGHAPLGESVGEMAELARAADARAAPRVPRRADQHRLPPGVPAVGAWADQVGVPVEPPTVGPVSSPFGPRRHPVWGGLRHHAGLDLAAGHGAPVHAAASGVVAAAGPAGGYGLRVEVFHPPSGLTTRYAHLSRFAPRLRVGAPVRRGQLVGLVGSTGVATGPHLHYEVLRPNGSALDPAALAAQYRAAHAHAVAELARAVQRERRGGETPTADGPTGR